VPFKNMVFTDADLASLNAFYLAAEMYDKT
jgi:hypothetical protein